MPDKKTAAFPFRAVRSGVEELCHERQKWRSKILFGKGNHWRTNTKTPK